MDDRARWALRGCLEPDRALLALCIAAACLLPAACAPGPAANAGGGTKGSDDGGSGSTTGTTSAGTGGSGASSTTTSGPTTTDAPTTQGPTTDEWPCGCNGEEIDASDEVEEEFSALDALELLDGVTLPLLWNLETPAETVVHITATYEGGPVYDIPGDECCSPCVFLYVPCPGGLEMQATLWLGTDDGLLDDPFSDTTIIVHGNGIYWIDTPYVAVDDLAGSLAQHTFFEDGEPVEFDTVVASIGFTPPNAGSVEVLGCGPDECHAIGSSP